jgi:hypothetical protein
LQPTKNPANRRGLVRLSIDHENKPYPIKRIIMMRGLEIVIFAIGELYAIRAGGQRPSQRVRPAVIASWALTGSALTGSKLQAEMRHQPIILFP